VGNGQISTKVSFFRSEPNFLDLLALRLDGCNQPVEAGDLGNLFFSRSTRIGLLVDIQYVSNRGVQFNANLELILAFGIVWRVLPSGQS
jgi:hypothetical protein